MAPTVTRRALLGASAIAGASGIVGYYLFFTGSGSSGDSPDEALGIQIENKIEQSDYEDTHIPTDNPLDIDAEPIEPEPATVTVTGEEIVQGGDNEPFYERTVDVPTNSTKTLENQIEVPTDDKMYALVATLEPIVGDPDNTTSGVDREDSITFQPGEYGTPNVDPIRVIVEDGDDANWLVPQVSLIVRE